MTAPRYFVNGEARTLASDMTVSDLLHAEGLHPEKVKGVAVALNNTVIRRAEWSRALVNDGDRVEIVTAQQGG